MKKIILLFGIVILASCGNPVMRTGGAVMRSTYKTSDETLIKTVAIEQNCDRKNIKIIEKINGVHGATYALDVCGKRVIYKRIGTVFMEKSEADKMLNNHKK